MKVGSYKVYLIDAGRFRLDGGAMYGVVPKVMWSSKNTVDEKNRIGMSTNLLLIQDKHRNILVDTGIGDKYDDKFKNIFAVDHSQHNLDSALQKIMLTANDITDVILTHLHFDHAGGATRKDGNNNLIPTFPNAKYYVQKDQLEWAKNPSPKDRASFFNENYLPLEERGQLVVLEDAIEIFPGIELIKVNGHTPSQQLVLIKGKPGLLFAADLIPMASHIPIPWVMAYDLYPMKTIEEKKIILRKAVEKKWLIFFEHDTQIRCGKLRKTEKDFALKEIIRID
jgi:glyoxylase-like metal-dependent hydrolase (beta-lactamase superfamily II)